MWVSIELRRTRARPTPRDVLRDVFGHVEFRPGQAEMIAAVLAGRDCLGVLPTGGGKSLVYQVPARILPGTVLVVSPLLALIKDQVDALGRRGLRATAITSTLDREARSERLGRLRRGEYELAYVAPEALGGPLGRVLGEVAVSLVAVDEAQCISEWGHDFRPAYRRLRGLKATAGGVPVLALTAVATPLVAGEVVRELGMVKPYRFTGSVFRPNLLLTARETGSGRSLHAPLLAAVRGRAGQSGIVYTRSRRRVEMLAAFLRATGVRAVPYHAGLPHAVRARSQEAFMCGAAHVVVATLAFGMGIDKPDVRYVIHRELPGSIERYYQEIGRAGRDGRPSEALLFHAWADVVAQTRLQQQIADPARRRLARARTVAMLELARAGGCRWQRLAAYFGERTQACRTSCDVCQGRTDPRVRTSRRGRKEASAEKIACSVSAAQLVPPVGRLRPLKGGPCLRMGRKL